MLHQQLLRAEQTRGESFFESEKERNRALALDTEALKARYPELWEEYLELIREPRGEADLDARRYIRMTQELREYIQSYEEGMPYGGLRKHQEDVFHDLLKFIERGKGRGYIEMPTGTGKTAVFVELVKALRGSGVGPKPLRALVLVPGVDILDQTVGRRGKKGFGKFAPEIRVSAYYQKEKDLTGDVVVSTYDSFLTLMKNRGINPSDFDVVICDEAHGVTGPERMESIGMIPQKTLVIGMTATSRYSREKKVADVLPERIHRMDLRAAVERGLLAKVRPTLVRTKATLDDIPVTDGGDFDPDALVKLIPDVARNHAGAGIAAQMAEQGLGVIMSCLPGENLKHARLMADLCRAQKIRDPKTGEERFLRAEVVSGNVDKDDRQELYERFERGEIDVLTFVNVLKEGWDSARAKGLINLRPTRSLVFAIQRLGRVLRINEAGDIAWVVDFEDQSRSRDHQPITAFDIFGIRDIRDDMVFGEDEEDQEEAEEGASTRGRGMIRIPPELLKHIKIETNITRDTTIMETKERVRGLLGFDERAWISTVLLRERFGLDDQWLKEKGIASQSVGRKAYVQAADVLQELAAYWTEAWTRRAAAKPDQTEQKEEKKSALRKDQLSKERKKEEAAFRVTDSYKKYGEPPAVFSRYAKVMGDTLDAFARDMDDRALTDAAQRWSDGDDRPPFLEELFAEGAWEEELFEVMDKMKSASLELFAMAAGKETFPADAFWKWMRDAEPEDRETLLKIVLAVRGKEPRLVKKILDHGWFADTFAADLKELRDTEMEKMLRRHAKFSDADLAGVLRALLGARRLVPRVLALAQERGLWERIWQEAEPVLQQPEYAELQVKMFDHIKRLPKDVLKRRPWVKFAVRKALLSQNEDALIYAMDAGYLDKWILEPEVLLRFTRSMFAFLEAAVDSLSARARASVALVGSARHGTAQFDRLLLDLDEHAPEDLKAAMSVLKQSEIIGLIARIPQLDKGGCFWQWLEEHLDEWSLDTAQWASSRMITIPTHETIELLPQKAKGYGWRGFRIKGRIDVTSSKGLSPAVVHAINEAAKKGETSLALPEAIRLSIKDIKKTGDGGWRANGIAT